MAELVQHWQPLALVSTLLLSLIVCAWLLVRHERKLAGIWDVVAEGEYDRVEYGYFDYSTRSGAMVHTTHYHRMTVTAVYFTDGRTCVCRGRHDMRHPRGTRLRISRNRVGDNRIERT